MNNKYYAHISLLDNSIGKGQCPCLGENIVCVEITQEVYDNIDKYIYQSGELIYDEDWEEKQKQKEREIEISKIKSQLDSLDFKSIRAIRAKDTEYIDKYEAEAVVLRNKIKELEKKING